jgi:MFS family permease
MANGTEENIPNISKFKRSWLLAKSSWRVLKLDKELVLFPFINSVLILGLLVLSVLTAFATHAVTLVHQKTGDMSYEGGFHSNLAWWQAAPLLLIVYILISFVTAFFGGAIVHAALERLKGGDPTVRNSLKAAGKRWKPLFFFGVMIGTVGFVLDYLQNQANRLPLGGAIVGKLLLSLGGFAWAVANFFSIPHIMTADTEISPIEATKRSVRTIKRVWGESAIANVGVGLIMFIVTILYVLFLAAIAGFGLNLASPAPFLIGVGAVGVLGLIVLSLVSETLGSILKATIFYYAETGNAPEHFDRALLRSAMTTKKARKIFG